MRNTTLSITALQAATSIAHLIQILPRHFRTGLCVILFTISPVSATEKPQIIEWDDLIPKMPQLDNPFATLSNEQVMDFEFLISTQNMRKRNLISNVDEAFEEAIEIRYKLVRQGLDVNGLISDFKRLEKEVKRRNKLINTQLDNKIVRIPGYALPLEHQGKGVREMLLVPYVGACIHVPPPPANQTVYVRLNKAHFLSELYEPVWITGRLSTKATSQKLYLVDGSDDVDTGYSLDGIKIESYVVE